jgi:hypothetical protein
MWEVFCWDEGTHTPVQQGGKKVPQVREDFHRNEEARARLQSGTANTTASRAEAQPSYGLRWAPRFESKTTLTPLDSRLVILGNE